MLVFFRGCFLRKVEGGGVAGACVWEMGPEEYVGVEFCRELGPEGYELRADALFGSGFREPSYTPVIIYIYNQMISDIKHTHTYIHYI